MDPKLDSRLKEISNDKSTITGWPDSNDVDSEKSTSVFIDYVAFIFIGPGLLSSLLFIVVLLRQMFD